MNRSINQIAQTLEQVGAAAIIAYARAAAPQISNDEAANIREVINCSSMAYSPLLTYSAIKEQLRVTGVR